MKNRWDTLKKDYTSWLHLKNPQNDCTGMGWDEAKKSVTAPDFWWEFIAQRNMNCLKFKDKGLEYESLLHDIFYGKTATGENQWTPGEDVTRTEQGNVVGNESTEEGFDEFGDIGIEQLITDGGIAGGSTQNIGSGERVRKRADIGGSGTSRKKRQSQAANLNKAMNRVISAVESQ